jgi:hypothetical protein
VAQEGWSDRTTDPDNDQSHWVPTERYADEKPDGRSSTTTDLAGMSVDSAAWGLVAWSGWKANIVAHQVRIRPDRCCAAFGGEPAAIE